MSEADLREGLRAAVGDEPPLRFDPDELIQRAQHERRRRRALVAVALVTVALTGTVLSLPGVLERRTVDAASGSVLTTTVSPAPSARPGPPPTTVAPATTAPKSAAGVTSFLSGYLTGRFPEVVPGSKVTAVQISEVLDADPVHYGAVVRFIDGIGPSGVVVRLTAPSGQEYFDRFCDEFECDEPQRREDGTRLATGMTGDPRTKVVVSRAVAHQRANGSVVQVTTYGYDPGMGSELGHVVLTVDQLVRLATDPNLNLP
ncbi:hypothetical protein FHX81_4571 [Saccharothrix saharensis]|uniref:Uncharacterized protein n=1 Tax=Saccharothrix saharensis TaxID=571190 RepID=A0A543JHD8_9PSEU|nr:hypothetical protein [Saccharothrix saharensis]TQM82174.1 hypothetical protein FHX81_4571 [Saccharothrix saharensis]